RFGSGFVIFLGAVFAFDFGDGLLTVFVGFEGFLGVDFGFALEALLGLRIGRQTSACGEAKVYPLETNLGAISDSGKRSKVRGMWPRFYTLTERSCCGRSQLAYGHDF